MPPLRCLSFRASGHAKLQLFCKAFIAKYIAASLSCKMSNTAKGGLVASRDEIEAALRTFTKPTRNEEEALCTYTNCAGFFRIRDKYFNRNELGTAAKFGHNLNKLFRCAG
jgi:hypothetical protein